MNIKEKVIYFWNDLLGIDEKEEENIETSNNPEIADLKESLARIKTMENNFTKSANSSKKGEIVTKVNVDSKKVAQIVVNQEKNKGEENKEMSK